MALSGDRLRRPIVGAAIVVSGQWRARRYGIAGIHGIPGIPGIVESVSLIEQNPRLSPDP